MKIVNFEGEEMSKKSQKSMKIVNFDLRNFNEIFRKNVAYNNIKSHKKPGFHSLSL